MKRIAWLGVAVVVGIRFVVVPLLTTHITMPLSAFVTRYIPPHLAPVNWGVGLLLIAVCEGPLLKPKYLSITLNVLLWTSILFFLGSWNSYPRVSSVVAVFAFIELNWLIPRWEARRVHQTAPTPPVASK